MRQGQGKIRAQEQRLAAIRQDLIRRIRPICTDMPDELFLDMIENMAAVKLKYELAGQGIAS